MVDELLSITDLRTHYVLPEGTVRAVDGVDLAVHPGRTLCVVGESGCGKSAMARSILQLVDPPGRIVGGQIRFRPEPGAAPVDIAALRRGSREIRAIRGKQIAMVFQEPMSALSPVHTIGDQIAEMVRLHEGASKREAHERAVEALREVGIPQPERRVDLYTFQLSGGMRQRAMIAMALVCRPKLLIADEPTTALDVTTQAQILELLAELQERLGMAVLFITHDLGVVAEIADEVAVMYLGVVAEHGLVDDIFHDPQHPYTQALLESLPRLGRRTVEQGRSRRLPTIRGIVPHPYQRPAGCPFHTRCDHAIEGRCDEALPPVVALEGGRAVRCVLAGSEEVAAP